MAHEVAKMTLLVVLLASLWDGTTAQSVSGCTKVLMGLSPCLNYVSGNTSSPSSSCCQQLSSVVQSQPQCLCTLVNADASQYGLNINRTLALGLPAECNVQTPPLSRCNGGNGPSASPATPNSPSGSASTSQTNIPSGSKSVPSTNGSNARAPSYVIAFVLLAASYVVSASGF